MSAPELALPDGWASAALGDIIKIIRGVSYAKEDARKQPADGLVPILRATNINGRLDFDDLVYVPEGRVSAEQRLQRGDIIIAASSGSLSVVGKAAQLTMDWKGSFGAFCMGIRVSPTVNSTYVANFLQTEEYRHRVSSLAAGSNINNLRRDHIQTIPFRVAPPNEQRRIVAKIEELFSDLDAGVAALERVRANLKRYRAAVLNAAVTGKLTEEWRKQNPPSENADQLLARILEERRKKWEAEQVRNFAETGKAPPNGWRLKYVEPAGIDATNLESLPAGWVWASVQQASDVQGGIQKQPKRAPKENAYPYLRVANVHRNRLDLAEIEKLELFGEELARLRLEAGDLLIVEGNGSRTEIGRSALWKAEIENCVHQNHIIRVRFRGGEPRFLNAYWNSPTSSKRVQAQSASTSGLYTLSVSKVSQLPFPLPPVDEQAQIVAEAERRLTVMEAVESEVGRALKRAGRLRQAILKRAFEGKLVPQDPADEPASIQTNTAQPKGKQAAGRSSARQAAAI